MRTLEQIHREFEEQYRKNVKPIDDRLAQLKAELAAAVAEGNT